MRLLKLILVLLVCTVGPAVSESHEDWQKTEYAFQPYWSGNPAKAAQQTRPLAERGSPSAQAMLGSFYEEGAGVPQDYVLAYKWYILAISRYDPETNFHARQEIITSRDKLRRNMVPAQIAEAQKLAREWKPK